MAALYYTAVEIRKNTWNTQTDREQRIQLQRPLLSPVDRRGERANMYDHCAVHPSLQSDVIMCSVMVCEGVLCLATIPSIL